MFEKLKNHIGHKIVCVAYGDNDNPQDICIECEDCNEVLVSAETSEKESVLTEETLKILLRNTIDAYEDECDMNSAEHFVEKLKDETGITNEEFNELFEGDKRILEDGSVATYIRIEFPVMEDEE